MTKKVLHPKIDPYVIATKQPHEIAYVIRRMKKEGIETNKVEILNAIKNVGKSRRRVYSFIRSCHV